MVSGTGGYGRRETRSVRPHHPRPLTTAERQVLDPLLAPEFSGVAELRAQAHAVEVVGHCDCGCPTIHLAVARELPRSACAAPDRLAPVEAEVASGPTGPNDQIILFVDDGLLSSMEYVWYGDRPPAGWPRPEELTIVRTDALPEPD
jgi:hypothetical protein